MSETTLKEREAARALANTRAEYAAIVAYHNSLVAIRFTIAGLFMAAEGFLVSAIFKPASELTWPWRGAGAGLALLVTVAVLVLELRTKALYRSLESRGRHIEEKVWGLLPKGQAFFARQYNEEPDQKQFRVFNRPVRKGLAEHITHSNGFLLLYLGSAAFWIMVCVVSVFQIAICITNTVPTPAP